MTDRERIMRTFRREPLDRVVWQPRLEHWYNCNKQWGTLPEQYRDMELFELYDELGCSIRYAGRPLRFTYEKCSVRTEATPQGRTTLYETPIGTLTEVHRSGEDGCSSYHAKFPIERLEDIPVMEYLLSDERVEFDQEAFEAIEARLGPRGVCQFYFPRSGLKRLIINFIGFEDTIYLLNDHRERMEQFLKHIERCDDQLFEVLCDSPVQILNFGDNIDAFLTPPPLFERYLLPHYERRCEQLRGAGKFTHIHMDGHLRPLLPLLSRLPQDGIEAPTPLPQGDVTPEELREAVGDKIILDGLTCLHFLPEYSYQELEEFTLRLLDLFAPNVILGISDEISPPGDIEKIRLVTEIVERYAL
jgi:hypothetical protein